MSFDWLLADITELVNADNALNGFLLVSIGAMAKYTQSLIKKNSEADEKTIKAKDVKIDRLEAEAISNIRKMSQLEADNSSHLRELDRKDSKIRDLEREIVLLKK